MFQRKYKDMEMSFPQDMEILIKWQLEKSVSREIMVKNHYNKLIFIGKKVSIFKDGYTIDAGGAEG